MFIDLNINIDNIESVITEYFKGKYSEVKVELNHKKTKENNKVYDINYDGNYLFISIFIKSNSKYSIKVKEGKNQKEKEKLAQYIVDKCSFNIEDNEEVCNSTYTYKYIDLETIDSLLVMLKLDEQIESIEETISNEIRTIYRIIGINKDKLTMTYYKTEKVVIQGKEKETFSYIRSIFDSIIGEEEVVKTLNENYNADTELSEIDRKYNDVMKYSKDKHSENFKKSLLSTMYNLIVDCQKSTYTDFIFEPMRLLEVHIIKTLYEDFGIRRPDNTEKRRFNNLYVFKRDKDTGEISFRNEDDRVKVANKGKEDYYLRAYNHIYKFRHSLYFHTDYNFELELEIINHIEDIQTARNLILDTLMLIDEYYK